MTTPRVTVPEAIEALKHCVENEKAHWSLSEICDPCVDVPVKYLRAAVEALSAAPAPDAGAVWPEVTDAWADTYCALTGRDPDGQQVTFVDGGVATTFRNVAKREIEAMLCAAPKSAVASLATREEAPAEAGDAFLSWLEGEIDEASLDIGAAHQEGGTATEREKARPSILSDVRAEYLALRAQPTFREDAQPVAGARLAKAMWGVDLVPAANPAPDALRVAVEALETINHIRSEMAGVPVDSEAANAWALALDAAADHARQALAALQAEQKGGA